MIKRRKYVLYGAAGVAGLALAAVVAALITVQTPWFREKVRQRIVTEIERATGGRVELARFDFDWKRLRASVSGLTIHGTEPAGEEPLFRAESVEVGAKIVSIVKRDIDIESLAVRQPAVHVIVAADGSTNVPRPKLRSESGRGAVEQILALAIQRFRLENGFVEVNRKRTPLDVAGENLRADVTYSAAEPSYQGKVSLERLNLKRGESEWPLDVDATFAVERNRLRLTPLRFGLGSSELSVTGALDNFASPTGEFVYSGTVRLVDLRLKPPIVRPDAGTVVLSGKARYAGGSDFRADGAVRASGIAVEQRGVSIRDITFSSDMTATLSGIVFPGVVVTALDGRATGRAEVERFEQLRFDGAVQGFSVKRLGRFDGIRQVAWDGRVSGPVSVRAGLRRGEPSDAVVKANLTVTAGQGENPLEGLVNMAYLQRTKSVEFTRSHLKTPSSSIEFSGVLGKRLEVRAESTNLDDSLPAFAMFSAKPPSQLPVRLDGGAAKFDGVVTGALRDPHIEGRATARAAIWDGRRIDSFTGDITAWRGGLEARNITATRNGTEVGGAIRLGLREWKTDPGSAILGNLTVRSSDAPTLLAETGKKLPLTAGRLTASVNLHGSLGDPRAEAKVEGAGIVYQGQALDRLQADVRYTADVLELRSAEVRMNGSHLDGSGAFVHAKGNWDSGILKFHVSGVDVQIQKVNAVQQKVKGVEGRLVGEMYGELAIGAAQQGQTAPFRMRGLDGAFELRGLGIDGKALGDVRLKAGTAGPVVKIGIDGALAGSKIAGETIWKLDGDYPVEGAVNFSRLDLAALRARFADAPPKETTYRAFAEGRVLFAGASTQPESLRAMVEVSRVEFGPMSVAEGIDPQEFALRNDGPVIVEVNTRRAQIRRAQFTGKDTKLNASGTLTFASRNPWNVRVQGGVNLAALESLDRDLSSSGTVLIDTTLRGALTRPEAYGRVELQKAAFSYGDLPNGIDNANAVLFLYRDRATIDSFTAESGGGKITATGFVTFADAMTYHLQAKAQDIRVRYPEGVSSTSNAVLTFTGTSDRSVLAGEVTVTRVGFNPRTDLGSILAKTAEPVQTTPRPNRFLQGLNFDVHIQTAPQVRLETKLTKDIQAEADLRLRGDPTRPVLLGRALITQGEIVFFGTEYEINSGEIVFVNPARIQPVVNMDLETRARGIDVTLSITGPINKLNVAYRSDPPLQVSEIVALLATGRAPQSTPLSPARTTDAPSQSFDNSAGGAILSQAIANPLAGRLQRFFGVSRLKIDPQITGLAQNAAAARVTIEQQITSNITFTYITNITQAQAQAIRVQLDLTKNWSAVALREENGLFGVDFLYRKQFK